MVYVVVVTSPEHVTGTTTTNIARIIHKLKLEAEVQLVQDSRLAFLCILLGTAREVKTQN